FRSFALAHVADDDGEQLFATGFGLRNRSLDGEFLAISAQTPQRTQGTHRSSRGTRITKAPDMCAVRCMEAFWDETVDGAPDCILHRAAKHFLGSGVEHNNSLSVIDGDDGVHR